MTSLKELCGCIAINFTSHFPFNTNGPPANKKPEDTMWTYSPIFTTNGSFIPTQEVSSVNKDNRRNYGVISLGAIFTTNAFILFRTKRLVAGEQQELKRTVNT